MPSFSLDDVALSDCDVAELSPPVAWSSVRILLLSCSIFRFIALYLSLTSLVAAGFAAGSEPSAAVAAKMVYLCITGSRANQYNVQTVYLCIYIKTLFLDIYGMEQRVFITKLLGKGKKKLAEGGDVH